MYKRQTGDTYIYFDVLVDTFFRMMVVEVTVSYWPINTNQQKCFNLIEHGDWGAWLVLAIYKGCTKKIVPVQKLKVAFLQEPFVQGGCPSHSLEYS